MKADQVASFLGKKITPQLAQELGSRFQTRIQGTCIKHRLGQAQVKMYDKAGLILRIETTVNTMAPTRGQAPMRTLPMQSFREPSVRRSPSGGTSSTSTSRDSTRS